MNRVPIVLLTLAGLVLAGCIQAPEAGDDGSSASATMTSGDARMSAEEQRKDSVGPCTGGGVGFCAERLVTVEGAISGIALLEVNLESVNGDVKVRDARAGTWSLVAKLKASGGTPDEAKRNLETIVFTWSHESGGDHHLSAVAEFPGRNENFQRSANLEVAMPRDVALRLVADTTNGDVEVKGVRTDGLSADTTNGDVVLDADVTQVSADTTNGDVEAKLNPVGSGRISLDSTNGGIRLAVPEDERRGYDLEGSTTNGKVDVTLRDGEVGPCPEGSQYYTPPCNHRTFKTDRYDSRAVRMLVALDTTNGDVTVSPA